MHSNEEPIKLALVGDDKCGKSALAQRAVGLSFNDKYSATIGVEFLTLNLPIFGEENLTQKVNIWDTAGQERFHSLTPMYTKGAQVILVVFDLTNRESFNHVPKYVEQYRKNNLNNQAKIILVGTKADDEGNRMVQKEEIEALKAELKLDAYVETSAKTDFNVRAVFEKAAELVLQTRNEQSAKENPKQAPEKTEEEVRQELIKQLDVYIKRVESHKISAKKGEKEGPSSEERINFGHGFWFFKESRALNRKANYKLAKQLKRKLEDKTQSISGIFKDEKVKALRDVISDKIKNKKENKGKYVERGIKSDTLNNIIKQGKKMR